MNRFVEIWQGFDVGEIMLNFKALIILVDGESVAAGYVTPYPLENVPEEKLC